MKENKIFEAIGSHQVDAPEHVMQSAIATAKRRRFFAFQWYSLNVWYVGLILIAASVFFLNARHEASVTANAPINTMVPVNTTPSDLALPVIEKQTTAIQAAVPAKSAVKKGMKNSSRISAESTATPTITVEPITDISNSTQFVTNENTTVPTKASILPSAEEKTPEKIEEVKLAATKKEKKKKIPVKVVQP